MSASPNLNSLTPKSIGDVFDEELLAASTPEPATQMSAAEYIGALFAADDLICIMTLQQGKNINHIFVPFAEATSDKFTASLHKQNEAGANIFICMNPLTAKRRIKENVGTIRTVYLDLDHNGATTLNKIADSLLVPKPHFVLQSSPGRFFVIWRVKDIKPADQERLLDALIPEFGGDPAASDMVRVLRLPGFKNHKYPDKPVVEVVESNFDGAAYTASDFHLKVASAKPIAAPIPAVIPDGKRNDTLASLAGSMRRRGASESAILAALRDTNKQCQSPLPDSEVAAIAKSISRYEPAKEVNENRPVVESGTSTTPPEIRQVYAGIKDMPESVLDGWLGQICKTRMLAHFPVAYAWTTLVTVASAMVPVDPTRPGMRCNLFGCPVGPVHTGKTEAITHAKQLLGIQAPPLLDLMAGSAEMLTSAVAEANGRSRLYSPDELGHLLEKAQIQNSSFVYLLNRAFYETGFRVRSMERNRREVIFNATLSLIGGVVDERFGDLFTSKTTGGFYDRFLYGLCPTGFRYFYTPFDGKPAIHISPTSASADEEAIMPFDAVGNQPVSVTLDKSVFIETRRWMQEDDVLKHPDCGRVVEIAMRVATICASFDQRSVLYGKDLGPAYELARYQARIRGILKPNPGKTFEGQLYHKFFEILTMHTSGGEWLTRRDVFRGTHSHEIGLTVANKTLDIMISNGDVEEFVERPVTGGRPKLLVRIARVKPIVT